MRPLQVLLMLTWIPVAVVWAEDWPQYRGPRRDDVSSEKGLLQSWPGGGPHWAWTYTEAGVGYSGPAVVGNRLYTLGGRGETEYLIALDIPATTERKVSAAWATAIGETFDFQGNKWSAGPSSTPTVDGDSVYALGGRGDLICVEATSGKERWRKNLPQELEAQVNPIGGGPKNLGWGFTWSPLVDGDRLVCVPGGPKGTVAALDKRTGDLLWQSAEVTDQAAYTSPMLATIAGVRQYVVLTNKHVVGVDAATGRVLWSYLRAPAYSTEVVNSPIVHDSLVYVTVGAGQGCDLVRVTREGETFQVSEVYRNRNMTNHHGNVLLKDDHLFGYSQGKGWICQSLLTGEVVWGDKQKLGAGSVTYADGRLYCYGEEDGTMVLLAASGTGWEEKGRFQLPQQSKLRKPGGKIWTPPVVANGKLFVRDQELLFCFDVRSR